MTTVSASGVSIDAERGQGGPTRRGQRGVTNGLVRGPNVRRAHRRPSAKRTSSRRRKRSVRSSSHSHDRASSGTRPPAPSARVSAMWSRSATRALVASAPKRGSRLCGSLSRATTRVPGVSESPMQPLEHSAHAEKSATMQPIWLTLFRALWYDPRRRRGSGGAEVSMRLVRGLLATFFLLSSSSRRRVRTPSHALRASSRTSRSGARSSPTTRGCRSLCTTPGTWTRSTRSSTSGRTTTSGRSRSTS
jgi:hypothetical protein